MKVKKVNICSFWQFRFSHLSRGIGIGVEDRDRHHTVNLISFDSLKMFSLHLHLGYDIILSCWYVLWSITLYCTRVRRTSSFKLRARFWGEWPASKRQNPQDIFQTWSAQGPQQVLHSWGKVLQKCESISLGRPSLVPQLTVWGSENLTRGDHTQRNTPQNLTFLWD